MPRRGPQEDPKANRDLTTTHPDLTAQWHPTLNGSLTPQQVTAGSNKKVQWVCPKGHECEAAVNSRAQGHGCPVCSNQQVLVGFNDLATTRPDLAAQWRPTRNGALTPQKVTAGSNKKVRWVCPKGHEYEATVNSRVRGHGCPVCSNQQVLAGFNDLATTRPDLAAQWHPTRNGALTPQQVTAGSHRRVRWTCPKGHEYEATVNKRAQGSGCPVCAGRQVLAGSNDLATTHPDLAAQWHPALNGDLTPQQVTAGSHKSAQWVCPKGHEWEAKICDRAGGTGCPVCVNRRVFAGFNNLATTHPDLAAQWHPTRNGALTPQQVTAGSHRRVRWTCPKGHEYEATVNKRAQGHGCPVCSNHQVLAGSNDLATTHPDLAAQWHPTRNGDLVPQQVTAGARKEVWWTCPKGHGYKARVSHRTVGSGCPVCNRGWTTKALVEFIEGLLPNVANLSACV